MLCLFDSSKQVIEKVPNPHLRAGHGGHELEPRLAQSTAPSSMGAPAPIPYMSRLDQPQRHAHQPIRPPLDLQHPMPASQAEMPGACRQPPPARAPHRANSPEVALVRPQPQQVAVAPQPPPHSLPAGPTKPDHTSPGVRVSAAQPPVSTQISPQLPKDHSPGMILEPPTTPYIYSA